MGFIQTGRNVHKTLQNVGRLRKILGVFVRHGFAETIERARLGSFVLDRVRSKDSAQIETAVRLRKSLEELGPTFIKLGQLLATRPDLIPEDWCQEFAKLHDSASPVDFALIENVLNSELTLEQKKQIASIQESPVGSASIAQVHLARLTNGESVVIKVQRPGIANLIRDDVQVLRFLAQLLEETIPESRSFRPQLIVDELWRSLTLECQFLVEANNIRKMSQNLQTKNEIQLPKVHLELCTDKVLVLGAFLVPPLSQIDQIENSQLLLKNLLQAYLEMVFQHGLFHADLHPGNVFPLADQKIGLIDFGLVGKLNRKTQYGIASMLWALAKEDYERLAFEYIELAPLSAEMMENLDLDQYARDLKNLLSPYYGLNLKSLQLGRLLMSSASISARYGLSLPSDLMLFFRSLMTFEGLASRLSPDFDLMQEALNYSQVLVQSPTQNERLKDELFVLGRESKGLIQQLPRQVHFFLRKLNSPFAVKKIEITNLNFAVLKLADSFSFFSLSLIIISLFLGSAWLLTVNAEVFHSHSTIGFSVGLGLLVWALIRRSR